jgi:hypothetical protein
VTPRNDEELERPAQWLRQLDEDASNYSALVAESGSLAVAAHRLASARNRVQIPSAPVPTLSELKAAAEDIVRHFTSDASIHAGVLVADCMLAGLPVIVPASVGSAA